VPSWPREPILPGKTSSVKVRYNTQKVGGINKVITVTSNAKTKPTITLRITGKVIVPPPEQAPEKAVIEGATPSAPQQMQPKIAPNQK